MNIKQDNNENNNNKNEQINTIPEDTNLTTEDTNLTTDDATLITDDTTSNTELKKKNNKSKIILSACALSLGVAGLTYLNNKNNNIANNSEDIVEDLEKVELDFTDKTAEQMREYYTLEGQEYIKKIYPDSEDSDVALLTVGKSLDKEFKDISFTTTNNKTIKLKDLKGKKVILDFALKDCPTCQEEFEYLSSKELGENEILLHIFPNDTTDEIKNTFKDLNINFNEEHTVSLTGMNDLEFSDFNITHVPTKFYINEEGIVTYITLEALSDSELYNLHYDRAFGNAEKMLDFLKNK